MNVNKLIILLAVVVVEISSYYVKQQYGTKNKQLRKLGNSRIIFRNTKETGFSKSREKVSLERRNMGNLIVNQFIKGKRRTPKRRKFQNKTNKRTNNKKIVRFIERRRPVQSNPTQESLVQGTVVGASNPISAEALRINGVDRANTVSVSNGVDRANTVSVRNGVARADTVSVNNGVDRANTVSVSNGVDRADTVSQGGFQSIIEPIDAIFEKESKNGALCDFFHDPDKKDIRVEGDIIMGYDEYIETYGLSKSKRNKRAITPSRNRRWPNNRIPVDADLSFNRNELSILVDAVLEWERYTCIKFDDVTADDIRFDRPRLRFVDSSSGCFSRIGRAGGLQTVSLTKRCRTKRVILHEIGHVIGFFHEHTRPDRDEYVNIDFSNIRPELHFNFRRVPNAIDFGVSYDYLSILHYSRKAFATNRNRDTIRARDGGFQRLMGNAIRLSFRDVKQANLLLNCRGRRNCNGRTCPGEGFLDKDCNCMCPSVFESATRCGGRGATLTVGISNFPFTNINVDNVRTLENVEGAINRLGGVDGSVPLVDREFLR